VQVLSDNYSYLLIDSKSRACAAVDVVEPHKVLEAASRANATVSMILTTHSHADHDGGNNKMKEMLDKEVPFVGGKGDGAQGITKEVQHNEKLELGDVSITVLETPCHTPGHVCYYAQAGERGVVFTGDTLFVGGSGNLNNGTPEMMYHALSNVLGGLPDSTEVYVGHNYTVRNLRWALAMEPHNAEAKAKLEEAQLCDANGEFIHSTIGAEKQHNPFMRTDLKHIQEWAHAPGNPIDTLLAVRQGKDAWGSSNR